MFLNIYSKSSWISDIEYYTSGNSNSSLHVGSEILSLLFYKTILYLHMYSKC